jgi:hypothetical protein
MTNYLNLIFTNQRNANPYRAIEQLESLSESDMFLLVTIVENPHAEMLETADFEVRQIVGIGKETHPVNGKLFSSIATRFISELSEEILTPNTASVDPIPAHVREAILRMGKLVHQNHKRLLTEQPDLELTKRFKMAFVMALEEMLTIPDTDE